MTIENTGSVLRRLEGKGFFSSHRLPLLTILIYVGFAAAAFTLRLIHYLADGDWRRSATRAFEFAPEALNTHTLTGMALIPLFFLQLVLGAFLLK